MDRAVTIKTSVCTVFGVVGGTIASAFGGWTSDLTTLVIMMAIDFVTGLMVAMFCKSKKTDSGGLSSTIGMKGLAKKVIILLLVLGAHRIDLTLHIDYVKTTAIIAFIVNELISIVENVGLLGLPMPAVMKRAIDVLKGKSEEDGKDVNNEKGN